MLCFVKCCSCVQFLFFFNQSSLESFAALAVNLQMIKSVTQRTQFFIKLQKFNFSCTTLCNFINGHFAFLKRFIEDSNHRTISEAKACRAPLGRFYRNNFLTIFIFTPRFSSQSLVSAYPVRSIYQLTFPSIEF